jgi:hypothetical protein
MKLHYCSLVLFTLARGDLFLGEKFFVFQNFVAKFLFFSKRVCVLLHVYLLATVLMVSYKRVIN